MIDLLVSGVVVECGVDIRTYDKRFGIMSNMLMVLNQAGESPTHDSLMAERHAR